MVVIFVGLLCWGLRYFPYYSYCRILRGGSFLFLPEPLSVKLLTLENPCSQESNRLETSEAYVLFQNGERQQSNIYLSTILIG